MKLSKNSKEHYFDVPNKDELMNNVGEINCIIMIILFVVFIIVMLQ